MTIGDNNTAKNPCRVETISQLHEIAGMGKPKHPLVTIIDYSKVNESDGPDSASFILSFYSVNYKTNCGFIYGREKFDHGEGTLICMAPDQVIHYHREVEVRETEGWGLYFHPDFIRGTSLEKKMKDYTFFNYGENEALHLSEDEKNTLLGIIRQIEAEYHTNIDHHSRDLMVSNIELLLNYCKRFYGRQFLTRTHRNRDIIARFEDFLISCITSGKLRTSGIPSVKLCAERMNLTPNYFSDLLKSETGKNTQEHIHYHLLEKAKDMLIGSDSTVNEIAYELGFEYPQYFSRLFRSKVGVTPTRYREGGDH